MYETYDPATSTFYRVVYGLFGPGDDLRYVGLTSSDLKVRLQQHYLDSKSTEKHEWLHSLRKAGIEVELRVIDRLPCAAFTDYATACQWERWWIAYFAILGVPLLNKLRNYKVDMLIQLVEDDRRKQAVA